MSVFEILPKIVQALQLQFLALGSTSSSLKFLTYKPDYNAK